MAIELPDELIDFILSKVVDARDVASVSCVCKKFSTLRWQTLEIDADKTKMEDALSGRQMEGLQRLVVLASSKELDFIGARQTGCRWASTLEELRITGKNVANLWSTLSDFPRLSTIEFHCNILDKPMPASSFQSLRTAILVTSSISCNDVHNLVSAAPLIETLRVVVRFGEGQSIVIHGPNLKWLEIAHWHNQVPEISLGRVQLTIARCEKLELVAADQLKGFEMDGRYSCSNLQEIIVNEVSTFDNQQLSYLLSESPHLRRLKIGCCPSLKSPVTITSKILQLFHYCPPRWYWLAWPVRLQCSLLLECDALEQLRFGFYCSLSRGSSLRKLSKLSIHGNWDSESLDRLVCWPFMTTNLLHLDLFNSPSLNILNFFKKTRSNLRTITISLDSVRGAATVMEVIGRVFALSSDLERVTLTLKYLDESEIEHVKRLVTGKASTASILYELPEWLGNCVDWMLLQHSLFGITLHRSSVVFRRRSINRPFDVSN